MIGFNAIGMDAIGMSGQSVPALTPDTTAPQMVGGITLSAISPTGAHAAWQAATDNVAVVGYELSVDTGTRQWLDVGNVLSVDIMGKQPDTDYTVWLRGYDGATPRNYATPSSAPLHTAALPIGAQPAPTTADISLMSMMRVTTLYLSAARGLPAINLTVSLS